MSYLRAKEFNTVIGQVESESCLPVLCILYNHHYPVEISTGFLLVSK
jgi:hypothetical protein